MLDPTKIFVSWMDFLPFSKEWRGEYIFEANYSDSILTLVKYHTIITLRFFWGNEIYPLECLDLEYKHIA